MRSKMLLTVLTALAAGSMNNLLSKRRLPSTKLPSCTLATLLRSKRPSMLSLTPSWTSPSPPPSLLSLPLMVTMTPLWPKLVRKRRSLRWTLTKWLPFSLLWHYEAVKHHQQKSISKRSFYFSSSTVSVVLMSCNCAPLFSFVFLILNSLKTLTINVIFQIEQKYTSKYTLIV